jgi:hypothetical protein
VILERNKEILTESKLETVPATCVRSPTVTDRGAGTLEYGTLACSSGTSSVTLGDVEVVVLLKWRPRISSTHGYSLQMGPWSPCTLNSSGFPSGKAQGTLTRSPSGVASGAAMETGARSTGMTRPGRASKHAVIERKSLRGAIADGLLGEPGSFAVKHHIPPMIAEALGAFALLRLGGTRTSK